MPLDFKRARQLCTEREFTLVEATRSEPLASLTPQRLQAKIARSRVLRGNFRDLAERQRREARGKIAPRGRRAARGNARTVEKAELFAEVLRRFEARAQKLAIVALAPPATRREMRPAAKRPSRRRATIARARTQPKTKVAPPRTARAAATASALRKQQKLARSPIVRKQAHVGSRNRRNQARSDAR
jgi:hypothetical protein